MNISLNVANQPTVESLSFRPKLLLQDIDFSGCNILLSDLNLSVSPALATSGGLSTSSIVEDWQPPSDHATTHSFASGSANVDASRSDIHLVYSGPEMFNAPAPEFKGSSNTPPLCPFAFPIVDEVALFQSASSLDLPSAPTPGYSNVCDNPPSDGDHGEEFNAPLAALHAPTR